MWIVVMVNMIFADIFSIMIELVKGGTINIIGSDVVTTMAIAALITNIPILMIFLSRVLSYKLNRILNIAASIFTVIYIIGGASSLAHYIIIASIEIVFLIMILLSAWKWRKEEAR
jgi:hypothetical protein